MMDAGLEAEFVFERDGVGRDEIEAADFRDEILLAHGRVGVALVDVDPDQACQVLGCKRKLRPVLAAFVVALVGSGGAEGEGETDDETQDCEE
jgi:hypothetical protein